jgi:hypothetical protein
MGVPVFKFIFSIYKINTGEKQVALPLAKSN